MSSGEFEFEVERMAVDEVFWDYLEDGPFSKCIVCGKYLLDDGVGYMIEKGIKGTEVIFEYALCDGCRDVKQQEMSAESMMRVAKYMQERIDFRERIQRLAGKGYGVDVWLDDCVVTGDKREELEAYQIYAQCDGKEMVLGVYPLMVGCGAMGEIYELLSQKTKDSLDDFVDEYLGLPSEFKGLPEDMPIDVM